MTLAVVVDDDPSIRAMMREILLLEGFRVRTAADGHAALCLLLQLPCRAIVLCDYLMPVLDGSDVLRGLALHPAWRARFVIFVHTAVPYSPKPLSDLGADGIIEMPFDVDQMVLNVRRGEEMLAQRRRKRFVNPYAYLRLV